MQSELVEKRKWRLKEKVNMCERQQIKMAFSLHGLILRV